MHFAILTRHLPVLSLSKYSLTNTKKACSPPQRADLHCNDQADKADENPKNPFQCCPEPMEQRAERPSSLGLSRVVTEEKLA